MHRDTFIFYRSFYEAIKELPANKQAMVFNAICEYSLNGIEIELTGLPNTVFILIKPQLEANNRRFLNGCKGAEHGSKGGAPKGNQNAKKTTATIDQNNGKTTPNKNEEYLINNKNVNIESYVLVIDSYTLNKDLKNSLINYVNMRCKSKTYTVEALKLNLEELDKITSFEPQKVMIVNQSIMKEWKTFYPLEKQKEKSERAF